MMCRELQSGPNGQSAVKHVAKDREQEAGPASYPRMFQTWGIVQESHCWSLEHVTSLPALVYIAYTDN